MIFARAAKANPRARSPFAAFLTEGALIVVAGLIGGCTKAPDHCHGGNPCQPGYECLANRCVTFRKHAVEFSEHRLLLEPSQMAVAQANGRLSAGVPPSIHFGGSNDRGQSLLVNFIANWKALRVTSAFLLLAPLSGTEASRRPVPLRVSRISLDWSAAGAAPRAALPTAEANATGIASAPLRIDVTHIVRYMQERPDTSHGLLIEATENAGLGVDYATGIGSGPPPRLEVYANSVRTPNSTASDE